jgi:hypothetical protein
LSFTRTASESVSTVETGPTCAFPPAAATDAAVGPGEVESLPPPHDMRRRALVMMAIVVRVRICDPGPECGLVRPADTKLQTFISE